MYLLFTARKGISSMQLAKEIGITQKSAWFVLHRLREAVGKDVDKLRGQVEIDETFIGGLESVGLVCCSRSGEANYLREAHAMTDESKRVPPELDRVTDAVLAYEPKPKTKASKRRARRKKKKPN